MLAIKNLSRRYGSLVASDHVSVALQPSEFFGLLLPNGTGKTTLVSLVPASAPPIANHSQIFE